MSKTGKAHKQMTHEARSASQRRSSSSSALRALASLNDEAWQKVAQCD